MKKHLSNFLLILLSVFVSVIAIEILLRIIPIPGIKYVHDRFDDVVGGAYYPLAMSIYRGPGGENVKRKVNSMGYLDVEHSGVKPDGIFRVGFFGDSNTAAEQVVLEKTFFRLIQEALKSEKVECLAFGNPGFSTVQSYLNSGRWADYYDLDLVVYVFCENDLGDNIKEIKQSPHRPYVVLSGDGFTIDDSFKERNHVKLETGYRVTSYLKAHSLFFATLFDRILLLQQYGIKMSVTEEEKTMATKPDKRKKDSIPNQNDLPSSWPDKWRDLATESAARIILKWKSELAAGSKEFAILYVPREMEMDNYPKDRDVWKPWLIELTRGNDISLINPSETFVQKIRQGIQIYDGHFTKAGNRVFADVFIDWFRKSSVSSGDGESL